MSANKSMEKSLNLKDHSLIPYSNHAASIDSCGENPKIFRNGEELYYLIAQTLFNWINYIKSVSKSLLFVSVFILFVLVSVSSC